MAHASDTLQYARQFGLRFASHFACGIYDGAQARPWHGVQAPPASQSICEVPSVAQVRQVP